MREKKYKTFVDVLTVLCILFPLLLALLATWQSGTYESAQIAAYIEDFAISEDLAHRIGESINTFGIGFDGAFFGASCTIMSNALLVYLFRVFIAVLTFIPKMALKFMHLPTGEKGR